MEANVTRTPSPTQATLCAICNKPTQDTRYCVRCTERMDEAHNERLIG